MPELAAKRGTERYAEEILHVVDGAVNDTKETSEEAPSLPTIHLETRTAEQLLLMWRETELALCARGFIRPISGIKSSLKMPGIDSRIYMFVDQCFLSFKSAQDLDVKSLARNWCDKSNELPVLTRDMKDAAAMDQLLRWLGTDRFGFMRKIVAGLLTHIDGERLRRQTL